MSAIENLPNEEWRDIVGYEGKYQVSNMGRVKSLTGMSLTVQGKLYPVKGKILKPITTRDGYKCVMLGNKGKIKRVHRLVAFAFLPNPNNFPIINHKDEVRGNNKAENLEWCDYKYNTNYGTCRQRIGESNSKTPIYQINPITNEIIRRWKSLSSAARSFGRPVGANITKCLTGVTSKAYGYKWAYAEK